MRLQKLCVLLGLVTLGLSGACGDDDVKNTPDPRLIEGGGVGDGAINGRVNIHVINGDTDEAIVGATILIGEPDETAMEGETDSDGLFTLDDGSLSGPTTVTVVADGYVTSTWFGANGANMTIPLNEVRAAGTTPTVAKATLTGTIAGWDSLPDPPANHFVIAIIAYSQTDELGGDENNIEQPGGGQGLPPNACVAVADTRECAWSLVSRTGKVAISATILDFDNKGTKDESDDVVTTVGYAVQTGVTVVANQNQSGLSLTMIADVDLTTVDMNLAAIPSAFDSSIAFVGLDLGTDGILQLGNYDSANPAPVLVPELTGMLSSGTYRGTALAANEDDEDDDNPITAVLKTGITDLSNGITFGPWLAQPSSLKLTDGEYSFTPVNDASYHIVALRDSNDNQVWEFALLDGRTAFTVPTVDPDPRPSGSLDLTVTAFEGTVDLTDFAIDDLADTLERLSIARETL